MATIRDNVVLIKTNLIEDVSVGEGSLYATKGQPTNQNIKVKYVNDVLSILVKSGRKKSAPVAERFISSIGNGDMIPSTWGFAGYPKELNFTFILNITWKNGEKSKVVLGQGSTGIRNNWWIGSPSMEGSSLTVGKDVLEVSPDSMKEDYKKVGELVKDKIPNSLHGLYDIAEKSVFKELLKDVNVFSIS